MTHSDVPRAPRPLSWQIVWLSLGFAGLLILLVGGLAWWAATRIDADALQRQLRSVGIGLQEISSQIPVEQDTSAQWDDAVVNLRAGNDQWIADNLAEWMSQYYRLDRLFLLDAHNQAIRAVVNGVRVPDDRYQRDRTAVEPLVASLRAQMATASWGEADSTAKITGLGALDRAVLGDGSVGIVSVRPIVPNTRLVRQTPGTEYLHVSIRIINDAISSAIADKFAIADLRFERAPAGDSSRAQYPVLNNAGRLLGFFTWQPYAPAFQLLRQTAPAIVAVIAVAGIVLLLLLRRLRRTSARLEVSEANAKYLAFHDPLARIPNRALFEDRLGRAIANARRSGDRLALHAIDLDHFKNVNDALGHLAGDDLIRQTSERLAGCIREVDTAARLGGDEFAIIQVGIKDVAEAVTLSQRIVSELQRPFDLGGHEARIGASVGVAISGENVEDPEDMMRQADVALYEAKTSGRARYQLFAGELDFAVRERRALELDLRHALATGDGLELVYQPIYHAASRRMAGAEALVRWNHPARGFLGPDVFVGLAEERGLIDQLGLWVLRQACRFGVNEPGLPWIAVNVSPLQFRDERFADRVFEVLAETGLASRRLEIEITEGLLLQNSAAIQATLTRLRADGVRVALDDFGTGYSSISYLRTHGVDKLKIDRSFVAQLGEDLEVDEIVRCIIGLASAMHMKVTGEGVETGNQQRMLEEMGCDQLQGYRLSRPLTAASLSALLRASDNAPQTARAS